MNNNKNVFVDVCKFLLIYQFSTTVSTSIHKTCELSKQQILYKFTFINLLILLCVVIVSTHFSGSNRATEYTKVARRKKAEHQGKVRKHDEVEKTIDRAEAKELFSVQMHRVVTAICTHARTRCGILLISYSFLLFAPRSS